MGRYAHREAVAGLTRALALVDRLPPEAREPARRGLLEQRGIAYSAVGDGAAAVEDLSAWVDSARTGATAAEEVRALLALSAAWSLRDRARSLAYAEQAVERSHAAADPELHVRTRGYAVYWSARMRGWHPRDAAASADALASARRSGHPGGLAAHLAMHAYADGVLRLVGPRHVDRRRRSRSYDARTRQRSRAHRRAAQQRAASHRWT